MERIKQALEKARLERQGSGQTSAPRPQSAHSAASSGPVNYTNTRIIAVPEETYREKRIISGLEQNQYTDAYKILRTQVLLRLRENRWNSLAITSPDTNESKTLTAINLAISLAMEVNYTVLLVDADLRNPSVHGYFGMEDGYGLSEYLTADKPLSDLLVHPEGISDFVILPGGKPLANSAEMLSSSKMSRLVEELKTRYPSRIILFDLPPLLSTADALAFSSYVDAALLVIQDGKTQAEDAKRAVDLLQGTNLIGTVLNKNWGPARQAGAEPNKGFSQIQGYVHLFRAAIVAWFKRLRGKKD